MAKTVKITLLIAILLAGTWYINDVQALGQRTAVIYMRAIAADLELTPTQVENLTKQQAYNYLIAEHPALPADKIKEFAYYWSGVKIMLLRDAFERQTIARLVLFKQRIEFAYPDAVGLQSEYARDLARQLLPLLYGEVDPNGL